MDELLEGNLVQSCVQDTLRRRIVTMHDWMTGGLTSKPRGNHMTSEAQTGLVPNLMSRAGTHQGCVCCEYGYLTAIGTPRLARQACIGVSQSMRHSNHR